MIYLQTFLYYTFFSSIVLIYGIGLNSIAEIGISKSNSLMFFIKAIMTILCTSMISWVIISKILVPLKLVELFPIIAFIIFTCVNSLFEGVIRIVTGKSSSEFIVSFLIVILSLSESTNILNVLIICFSAMVSLLILMPLCLTFKSRVIANGKHINEHYYSMFFILLAILIFIMSVSDISWLNPGVMK